MNFQSFEKEDWKKNLAPHLKTRSRILDDHSKHAGVAIVFSKIKGKWSLLFMERAIHPQDPWSGDISLPGGRFDKSDKDFQSTAARELEEELGVVTGQGDLLGSLEGFLAKGFDTFIHPSVWVVDREIEFNLDPVEAQGVFWLPLSYLLDPLSVNYRFFSTRRSNYYFPAVSYQNYTIWGLTFGVLTQLVEKFHDASLIGHKTWPFYFSQTSN